MKEAIERVIELSRKDSYAKGLVFALRVIKETKMTTETAPVLVGIAEKIQAEVAGIETSGGKK